MIERPGPAWALQSWLLAGLSKFPLDADTISCARDDTFVPVHGRPGCDVRRSHVLEIVQIQRTNPLTTGVIPRVLVVDLRVCVCVCV